MRSGSHIASESMKKVGLVLKADGSKEFVKSLKSISAELKSNYENFKLTQAQYDKNTSTTQKLIDKQDYLTKAYDITSQKVKTLETELELLEQAEKKDQNAIEKKRISLTQAKTSLENYSKQLEETNNHIKAGTANIEDLAKKIDSSSTKITNAGKKLSVVSAGVAAVGAAGIASFNEVDNGMDNIVKKTGAIGDKAKDLEKTYQNVSSEIVGDFSEIGNALGEINTRFEFTGEALENCSKSFIKFAKINDVDVTSSVQNVSRYMGDASISNSEYSKVLDNLTVAAQASGISMDNLTSLLVKYGAPMRALGLTTEESISIFAGWEKAGVNTEIAFSGMKKAISTWASSGKDAKVEFKNILQEIEKCPDIASATTKAIEVFGQKAGPDLADAIKGGRFEYEEYLNLLENSTGVVDDTYNEIIDGNDKAALAMQNAKLAMSDIGKVLMEILLPFLESATESLKKFKEWWDNLSPGMKKVIGIIGLVIAVLGPLLIFIGKVGSGISSLVSAFKTFKSVTTLASKGISFFSSLLTPTTLIIAAVVAAVALLAYVIYKNWDDIVTWTSEFKEKFISFFNNIVDFINDVFCMDFSDSLGPIGDLLNSVLANIENIFNSIKGIFSGIIDFIKNVFTGNWKGAWESVKNIFKGVFDLLYSIAKAPLNLIIGALNGFISAFNVVIKGINKIKIPDWDIFGDLAGKGLNISEINKIEYLAKGGELIKGTAIVGEAGPEMLVNNGKRTKVMPLTNGGGANPVNIIDYDKLFRIFVKALNSCSLKLDKDGFVRFINDVLLEVV